MRSKIILPVFVVMLLFGCTPQPNNSDLPAPVFTLTPASTATATVTPVATGESVSESTATVYSELLAVCSPLPMWKSYEELEESITNPFHPPPLGSDDPHHGVDFSQLAGEGGYAVPGADVQAVLSGKIAAVLPERFPYGLAVLVETTMQEIPDELVKQIGIPDPLPVRSVTSALTCPPINASNQTTSKSLSLYLLYAHLSTVAELEVGEEVECGDALGKVGSTGNALNPHLHLEMRVGPSGLSIPSMAHYDSSATAEEMAAYCQWRVEGTFVPIDPLPLLQTLP